MSLELGIDSSAKNNTRESLSSPPNRKPPSRQKRISSDFQKTPGSWDSLLHDSSLETSGSETVHVGVDSEIGRLRKVIVHSPGSEVELMTPKTATELLYNDIIHTPQVREGHAQLKGVLSIVAEVLEVSECLEYVLHMSHAKAQLVSELTTYYKCPEMFRSLYQMPADQLARSIISGVSLSRDSLETYLSPKSFSLVPLPNMYFMRDSSVVVGDRMIASGMASSVRSAEALIMRALFRYHPNLKCQGTLLDATSINSADPTVTIEGGDVLVINKDLLLIGISERTTPRAIDKLIQAMVDARKADGRAEPFNILAVQLPQERSTIHLDMVFTIVNTEQALVYAPYILERERARVIRIRVNPDGDKKFKEVDDLLLGLRSVGVRMDPILCGGDNPLYQQREQWNSGANMFAFGPGKVLSYEMHEHTVKSCENAGFKSYHANEIIKNPSLLDSKQPMVVLVSGTELARGGGGPRCMTCPVLRDPLPY